MRYRLNWRDLTALTWATGMMLSPEALTLQGNFTGLNGAFFVWPLIGALILHGLNQYCRDAGPALPDTAADEVDRLTLAFGPYVASTLLHLARPLAAIFLATATLVTAGFVFNETFVYWFPNFAFAGILLLLILTANLLGSTVATFLQTISVGTAFLGLATLSIVGALQSIDQPPMETTVLATPPIYGSALALMLFLGYDLLPHTPGKNHNGPNQADKRLWLSLLIVGALFMVWNSVSLIQVTAVPLSDATIPHILSARAIAGQTGRYIIGIVAIAGTIATVNLLFHAVSRMGILMAQKGLLPLRIGRDKRMIIPLITLSALTGLMMFMGVAGSDHLDLIIHSTLLLWIVFHAMFQDID